MKSSFLLLVRCLQRGKELYPNRWHPSSHLRRLHDGKTLKIVSILLACLTTYLLLSAFSLREPLHYRLASDPGLKGEAKDGQCMDYAIALSSRLAANGIHGQLIFYRWHLRATQLQGSHVFVRYCLPDKTELIVDNEIPHPKAVPASANLVQLVFLLSDAQSGAVEVDLQDELNHLSYF